MPKHAFRLLSLFVLVGGALAVAQVPAARPLPLAPAPNAGPASSGRVIATFDGATPITTEDFGKYLMDRGGADKLETYINIRIIEAEAARRKIEVTKAEMTASLKQDIGGLSVDHEQFVKVVLPKYGKNLFEWMEDVVRPRLLLAKMCEGEVKVKDEDLKIQYDRIFGEKRRAQMILWPSSDDAKSVMKRWDALRNNETEYDSQARAQPNPSLAAARGHMKPISKYMPGEDKTVEIMAFKLKVGEVSEPIKTPEGWVILKVTEEIPATKETSFEKEKDSLYAAAYEEALRIHIPKKFAELKAKSQPKSEYLAPNEWQTVPKSEVGSIIKPGTGGVIQTGGGK